MSKTSSSTNDRMAEANRPLDLVEEYLPLRKDEWERTSNFTTTRSRSWAKRDFEILRRTFKPLYSTRKPTGKPSIPPHIERAESLKRAMDEKASVIEMDDCANEDSNDEPDEEDGQEEDRPIEPDFSFDYEPDNLLFPDRGGDGGAVADGADSPTGVSLSTFIGTEASTDTADVSSHRSEEPICANAQPAFDIRVGVDDLETFAPASKHGTALRSAGLHKSKKYHVVKRYKPTVTKPKTTQRPDNHKEDSARGITDMQTASNHLGGGNLRALQARLQAK